LVLYGDGQRILNNFQSVRLSPGRKIWLLAHPLLLYLQ
jgi:hypothetical protein